MAVKIYDTMTTASDGFPLAYAEKINIKKTDGSEENLQSLYNNGELGGSGGGSGTSYIELSEEEYLALSDEERASEVEYRTYDTGRIFKRGVEFGKETDISSKQDNLSQVKFTMRRNSASEGRYCLIGSSDLSQNLLMCEPYRFQGIFGDGTTSVENKSIIDFMVSFREGVENPDEVLSGFANSSKGFEFVDLLITADETTNTAYAYVDFKTSGAVATGEITKPVLEAESYMDFAESFELTENYIGTLVCKMSDYCKVITEISDEVSDSTVWSSKKTSGELKGRLLTTQIAPNSLGFDVGSTVTLEEFLRAIYNKYGTSGTLGFWWSGSNEIYVEHNGTKVKINGGIFTWQSTNINNGWQHITAIYTPNSSANTMYKMFLNTGEEASTITSQGIEVIPTLSDTSSATSTYSSAKIDEKIDGTTIKTTSTTGSEYYAITFKDKQFERGNNQGILIQHNRLNFEPVTFIFSASSYWAAVYERDNYDVTKINGSFYNPTSPYMMQFYMDKTNNTLYLSVPSYSGVSLTDLQFKGDAITYTKVSAIPDTATKITVTEYASIDDTSTGDTNSTWSSSKIANEIGRTQVPHVGTSTGWKATKDLSSLPIGTYRLTSMHSSSGSVIDALILKTGYSYFLKTILKEGANITVGISDDTLTVAESTTSIGVISVFLNVVGINA